MSVEVASLPTEERPLTPAVAGFWRRLAAWIVDWWLIGVAFVVIDLIAGAFTHGQGSTWSTVLETLLVLAYFTYLWGARGQTIGYMLLRMQLGRPDGAPVGYGRALLRVLLILLSVGLALVPAIVSVFTTAFGPRKRALHDLILGTRVIRV